MTNNTKPTQSNKPMANQFDSLLEAWRANQDVTWPELMAAWVEAPTAPRSTETIVKLIKRLATA